MKLTEHQARCVTVLLAQFGKRTGGSLRRAIDALPEPRADETLFVRFGERTDLTVGIADLEWFISRAPKDEADALKTLRDTGPGFFLSLDDGRNTMTTYLNTSPSETRHG
jgi:hypothetical protein